VKKAARPIYKQIFVAALGVTWLAHATMASEALPATTREYQLVRQPDGQYTRHLERAPVPEIGDHDVLVHIHAVSIQRADIDDFRQVPDWLHIKDHVVAGTDAAGDVVRAGRLVTTVRPGQKVISYLFVDYVDHPLTSTIMTNVLGVNVDGVLGDYVVLKDTAVVPMPNYLSYEEAATLPSSGITAWVALGIQQNLVRKGDTVLVEGTGGVSTFALQFAVAAGAKVIATSSSDEKLQKVEEMGAKGGINYKKVPDWGDEVLKQTGGHGADMVVDIGGRSTIEQSLKALAYEGNVALVGTLGGSGASLPTDALMSKAATARGVWAGARTDFLKMCKFMEQHRIHPVVAKTYPFEDLDAALKDLDSGNFMGKLVLVL
jgi:NADPH:quinone reductase-like Zn-dependent oxidoreductase